MSEIDFQGETEQSLVAGLRQGRQEMLGKLYDAYAPVMMGVITRIVQHPEVAEEVLCETFVAIWARIGIYDSSKERLLTWGLAIARGIALQAVKTGRNQAPGKCKSAEPVQKEATAKGVLPGDLCSLQPLERTVLESVYLKGQSCAETAGELNIQEEEVKEVLKKAFAQLKAGKSI